MEHLYIIIPWQKVKDLNIKINKDINVCAINVYLVHDY